jgi:hypothetical protein
MAWSLEVATHSLKPEIFELFLKKGADPNDKRRFGKAESASHEVPI